MSSSSIEIRGWLFDGALPDLESTQSGAGELYDLLQCRIASRIPSCCSNAESSFFVTGVCRIADAERLLPNRFRTSRNTAPPPPPPLFSSFLGENTDDAGDDDGVVTDFSDNLDFSPLRFETLAFIRFKYLFTTSFENRFEGV
ncbi:hypothetical protein HanRHA438_Chr09g0395971 [Helianthus annuus]|nr:hypothetical protein HanRHA438_Chr09g0395971 [Helianthus annuus]